MFPSLFIWLFCSMQIPVFLLSIKGNILELKSWIKCAVGTFSLRSKQKPSVITGISYETSSNNNSFTRGSRQSNYWLGSPSSIAVFQARAGAAGKTN